ncbi:MAG: hypothetical protein WCD66_08250 [Rhodanobacteraceae bacterium]
MRPAKLRFLLPSLAILILAACSQQADHAAPAAQQQAQDTRTQQDLALYQKLRSKQQFELAAPIGEGVVARAPNSPAAAEIRKTLADTQARAKTINEKNRLQQLWIYQSGEESGGRQNTATLHPSRPVAERNRIRLILRRHSAWGQSVYLYDGDGKGFVCKGQCKLALKVDDKPAEPLKASLPDTSDPAMFIDNDKRFLKLLDTATTLSITVTIKGDGQRELFFEAGGFDPDRWPEPGKSTGRK